MELMKGKRLNTYSKSSCAGDLVFDSLFNGVSHVSEEGSLLCEQQSRGSSGLVRHGPERRRVHDGGLRT